MFAVPILLGAFQPAQAKITQIVIATRVPAYGGFVFPNTGAYEQLDGTAFGELDPRDPLNEVITDTKLAPRNARGMVEYSTDISILKPLDMTRSNGILFYEDVNRGNKNTPAFNIGGSATVQGDGYIESQGYTMAWAGWEGDITTGVKINLPVAKNPDGSAITGTVRAEYILNAPASTQDVTAPPAYEAVSTSNAGASLTMRVHQTDPRVTIPNDQWAFADCTATPFPGVPSTLKVCLKGGFDTNHIYELLYTAKNPTVTGIGFAAMRDFGSFLRARNDDGGHGDGHGGGKGGGRDCDRDDHHHQNDDGALAAQNPLGNAIKHVLIYGSSQSGRWIRTFIELGFNEDENGRKVVDGAIPHKSSNRGAFNIRFAAHPSLGHAAHRAAISRRGVAADLRGQLRPHLRSRRRATRPLPHVPYLPEDHPHQHGHRVVAGGDVARHHRLLRSPRSAHRARSAHLRVLRHDARRRRSAEPAARGAAGFPRRLPAAVEQQPVRVGTARAARGPA